MPTIATTTNATPFIYPSTKLLQYDVFGLNYLWCLVKASTADTYAVYRSTDGGASWSLYNSFVRTAIQEIGSILPAGGAPPWFMYFVYRTNEGSQDRVYLKKFDLTTGTWEAERLVTVVGNGGVAGSIYQGMDIRVVVTPVSGTFVAVAVGTNIGGNRGCSVYGVYEPDYYTPTSFAVTQSIFAGSFEWYPEAGSGRIAPSLDLEHNGDGGGGPAGYGVSPHLWLSFGRTNLYAVKMAWTGGGWSGPAAPVLIKSGMTAQDSISARWDGERFLMAIPNPGAGLTSTVLVCERNRANSATIERTTPVHPTGVVRSCTISYNGVSGDFRVYAVGTSTTVLYYVDFIRGTGSWTSWTQVLATAVLGATGNNYGVRPGIAGDAKYDVYTAHSGAPNTLTHTQQSLSFAPFAPTWVAPAASGRAADVGQTLLLDWTFSDPDAADSQLAFAISRQIGAGALAYFRASDSTWQPAEVQNTSGTSSRTLAAAWGVHTDAVHTYKVKVWDQANVPSAYSDAMAVVPSTPVNPTITSPAPAAVISGDQVTVTWTVAEQTAWSVQLRTNPGGVEVFDTGWAPNQQVPGTPTQLTYLVPYTLPNGTGWTLLVQTRNLEGLDSALASVNFTVVYVAPAGPTLVTTPNPAAGVITVAITNPTPVGTQPAVVNNEVWRRPIAGHGTILNSNPFVNANITGWVATGGAVAFEGTIVHEGAGSMKVTPSGVALDAYGEGNKVPVVQGANYTAEAWIRPVTANKTPTVYIHWFTAGSVYISSSVASVSAVAGAWLYCTVTGTPPPTATQASMAAGVTGTPAAGDIVYCDEMKLTAADLSTGVRVGAGVPSGGSYEDWQAVSGVPYEYRILANGLNGSSGFGPWTA